MVVYLRSRIPAQESGTFGPVEIMPPPPKSNSVEAGAPDGALRGSDGGASDSGADAQK
jgi:hypothetical protein